MTKHMIIGEQHLRFVDAVNSRECFYKPCIQFNCHSKSSIMSDQTKEAAPDPDPAAATATNDAAPQKDEATSATATKLENGSGRMEENVSNGAKVAVSGQDLVENAVSVQKEEASSYRGDSRSSYPKRQNKSKYDPNAEPVPDDAETRAQKIRNLVCWSGVSLTYKLLITSRLFTGRFLFQRFQSSHRHVPQKSNGRTDKPSGESRSYS